MSDYYNIVFLQIVINKKLFGEIKLDRMSFNLFVNILLSEEDCQASQKAPFRNTCAAEHKIFVKPEKRLNASSVNKTNFGIQKLD